MSILGSQRRCKSRQINIIAIGEFIEKSTVAMLMCSGNCSDSQWIRNMFMYVGVTLRRGRHFRVLGSLRKLKRFQNARQLR